MDLELDQTRVDPPFYGETNIDGCKKCKSVSQLYQYSENSGPKVQPVNIFEDSG